MSTNSVLTYVCLSLAVCLVVGETFSKTFRIPAGKNISLTELEVGGVAQLTDVFVTEEVDFIYCAGYEMKNVDTIYLGNLREDVEACLVSKTCTEVSWLPSGLVEVRCFGYSSASDALALNVVATYNITEGVRFVKSSPPLSLVTDSMNMNCSAGQEISLTDMAVVTVGRQLGVCDKLKSARTTQAVWSLLLACRPPCVSVDLPVNADYGCRGVEGLVKYNNITNTTDISEVYVFYGCVNEMQSRTTQTDVTTVFTTTSHAHKSSRNPWIPVAIVFIILFCLVLITAVILFVRYRKMLMEKEEEAKFISLEGVRMKNNNNSGDEKKERGEPVKKAAMASPYAVQSLPQATRKPPSTISVEPESYVYIDDRRIELTGKESAVMNLNEPARYEDLDSAAMTPTEEQYEVVTVRKDSTKPQTLQVDQPKNDRTSVASYIYFE